jgi:hypothetical protein
MQQKKEKSIQQRLTEIVDLYKNEMLAVIRETPAGSTKKEVLEKVGTVFSEMSLAIDVLEIPEEIDSATLYDNAISGASTVDLVQELEERGDAIDELIEASGQDDLLEKIGEEVVCAWLTEGGWSLIRVENIHQRQELENFTTRYIWPSYNQQQKHLSI